MPMSAKQIQQALDDTMPIIALLTDSDLLHAHGQNHTVVLQQLFRALETFQAIPPSSDLIAYYERWRAHQQYDEMWRRPLELQGGEIDERQRLDDAASSK